MAENRLRSGWENVVEKVLCKAITTRKYYPVWLVGCSRNHRMEAAASGFEGNYSNWRKQCLVLRWRMGSVRNFPVRLQKVDSVERIHASSGNETNGRS